MKSCPAQGGSSGIMAEVIIWIRGRVAPETMPRGQEAGMHADRNAGDDSGDDQAADSGEQDDDASSALPVGTGGPLAVV